MYAANLFSEMSIVENQNWFRFIYTRNGIDNFRTTRPKRVYQKNLKIIEILQKKNPIKVVEKFLDSISFLKSSRFVARLSFFVGKNTTSFAYEWLSTPAVKHFCK